MGIKLSMPSPPVRSLVTALVLIACTGEAFPQHSIGGLVGWTRSDHWYRSTVSAGLLYTHAFLGNRMHARASAVCHIPTFGRREDPYDGKPAPIAPNVGNQMSTYDRYWGLDADADVLIRIARIEQRTVEVHALSGLGLRHERFDYQSTVTDPRTGATVELIGEELRDRFALRAGLGSSIGAGAGKLFVEVVTDAWSYVADKSKYQTPEPLETSGIRFGFVHPIGKD